MPLALQGKYQRFFLFGFHPAEDRILLAGFVDILIGFQRGHIHPAVPPGNARALRDHGYGDRVVSGDDPDIDALLPEIEQRLIHSGTKLIGKNAKPADLLDRRNRLRCHQALTFCQHDYALAVGSVGFHLRANIRRILISQYKLRRAEDQRRSVVEGCGGFFSFGGEGKDGARFLCAGYQFLPQGVQCTAFFVKYTQQPAQRFFRFFLGALDPDNLFQFHFPGRNCTGLVQAEHVGPGKRLDSRKLLNQRLPAAELDDADGHGDACQQDQPFRNHPDHGRHGGGNCFRNLSMIQQELFQEQQNSQWHQNHGVKTYQLSQVGHQPGFGTSFLLGFGSQPAGIAFIPDIDQLDCHAAFHDIGSGVQPAVDFLMNGIALAGQQGFHRGAGPIDHDTVGNNLVSSPENYKVPLYGFVRGGGYFLSLAQHMHGRGIQQFQRGYGLLGPVFLHRADQNVCDHHKDEQHIPVASDQ